MIRFPMLPMLLLATTLPAAAETFVVVENRSSLDFSCEVRVSGAPLDPEAWEPGVTSVKAGETAEVLRFNRDSGITDGETFQFDTRLMAAGGEIQLHQNLQGLWNGSDLYFSVDANPYHDDGAHEAGYLVGNRPGRIRYSRVDLGLDSRIHYLLEDAPASVVASAEFSVLAYNVYMLPYAFKFSGQDERARRIPAQVRGHDVLVISEAFDDGPREILIEGLRADYPYITDMVGEDEDFEQDGGVFIASRWPIVTQRQVVFDEDLPVGNDKFSEKGVVYACVARPDGRFHVFGTHTQAGLDEEAADVRAAQLGEIADLARSLAIPQGEPVLVAGDLNVDRGRAAEHGRMCSILGAEEPERVEGHPFSSDPGSNDLCEDDEPAYFDYVLWNRDHLKPVSSSMQVIPLKNDEPFEFSVVGALGTLGRRRTTDLSDHYPVLGTFLFPGRGSPVAFVEGPGGSGEAQVRSTSRILGVRLGN